MPVEKKFVFHLLSISMIKTTYSKSNINQGSSINDITHFDPVHNCLNIYKNAYTPLSRNHWHIGLWRHLWTTPNELLDLYLFFQQPTLAMKWWVVYPVMSPPAFTMAGPSWRRKLRSEKRSWASAGTPTTKTSKNQS